MNESITLTALEGIHPNFIEGTCDLASYAVYNSKGVAEVSHETTAAMGPELRKQCYLIEAKGKRVL